MKTNVNSTTATCDYCGLLTIVFVILKLTNTVDWSWWIVLCPLWIPFALGLFALSICCIIFGLWYFWLIFNDKN